MLEEQNNNVFIRSDGWVYSKESMNRLKESGLEGAKKYKENMEERVGGSWHRVLKPLDKSAADIVKSIKGFAPRTVFLSSAIVDEAGRIMGKKAANHPTSISDKPAKAVFMRLSLTTEAYNIVSGMDNNGFREFVSRAILSAKTK